MNTNFNPARVIQTHYKEVPAHPIHGAKHWEVVGRGIGKDGTDVVLGSSPALGDALRDASRKVSEDYPGFTL